jgi:site-specific DNA-methyltransferase (adenine-specific)
MKDIELFNDHFQNYKTYGIPKAQLIIADIPYNIGIYWRWRCRRYWRSL